MSSLQISFGRSRTFSRVETAFQSNEWFWRLCLFGIVNAIKCLFRIQFSWLFVSSISTLWYIESLTDTSSINNGMNRSLYMHISYQQSFIYLHNDIPSILIAGFPRYLDQYRPNIINLGESLKQRDEIIKFTIIGIIIPTTWSKCILRVEAIRGRRVVHNDYIFQITSNYRKILNICFFRIQVSTVLSK